MNNNGYHSADNGFACAAAGRGITETLREHLNIIVRNEELEIATSKAEIQAEIDALVDDKERLEQQKLDRQDSINELTKSLAAKEVDLAELQIELDTPVNTPPDGNIEESIKEQMELRDAKEVERARLGTSLQVHQHSELNLDGRTPKKISIFQLVYAIFATCIVFGILAYLFIFYASAGEKSLILESATAGKIINHSAFSQAWQAEPKNWLIICFPFVFVGFALMIHCFVIENILMENNREKWWLSAVKITFGILGLLVILYLDFMIAKKIARDIYEWKEQMGYDVGEWRDLNSDTQLILLLGFVVALFLSFVWYYVQQLWKSVRPQPNQIPPEKNPDKIQLVALETEIQQIGDGIAALNQQKSDDKTQLQQDSKHPTQKEMSRLNTEKAGLQGEIAALSEQVDSLQIEINQCESDIDNFAKKLTSRRVDLKKLEAQSNMFVSGWCRYVASCKTEMSDDVSAQIRGIQAMADEILETYKASLTTI